MSPRSVALAIAAPGAAMSPRALLGWVCLVVMLLCVVRIALDDGER